MSQANVEIVRRYFWAFENDVDAFREITHPEVEWAPFEDNHTVFHGVDAAMQMRNRWLDTWDEHRIDTEEVLDQGDDVVALLHLTARGKRSGVEVGIRLYYQCKLRDGKVVYVYEHEDREEALKAVGLAE